MFKQMSEYFELFLSNYQCGFRKGLSSENCLLSMLEKCKSAIDYRKTFGALLTDHSKVFDCLSHDRLIAKQNATLTLFQGFYDNHMKANQDKC